VEVLSFSSLKERDIFCSLDSREDLRLFVFVLVGTYDELIKLNGAFKQLIQKQEI
jgi:hypothetical protein